MWRAHREHIADLRLLAVLVAFDVCFVALYAINATTSLLNDPLFSIQMEGGYAERFQYVKELSTAVMLALVAASRRMSLFAVLSSMYLYLLFDDSLEIHERLGEAIASAFHFPAMYRLRATDFGELVVSGVAGVAFLGAVYIACRRSDPASKVVARSFLILTAALAFVGVVLDMAQVAARGQTLHRALTVLEDGGELVVMSGITALAYAVFSSHMRAAAPLRREA